MVRQLAGNNRPAVLWPISDRATAPTEGLQYPGRPSVGGFGGVGRPSPSRFGGVGRPSPNGVDYFLRVALFHLVQHGPTVVAIQVRLRLPFRFGSEFLDTKTHQEGAGGEVINY